MYEFFEHTADVGIRIQAQTLTEALVDAGRALSALIVENLDDVRPLEEVQIEVPQTAASTDSLDYLLFDWLNALLHEFGSTGRIFSAFDLHVTPERIVARCRGEQLDPDRRQLGHEVKAITYHQLEFRQTDRGYCGQVIVDL